MLQLLVSPRTFRLSEAQNHRCCYCGARMDGSAPSLLPTLEHVVPVADGGPDSDDNLVAACSPCNSRRADVPLAVFLGLGPEEAALLDALLAAIPRRSVSPRRVQGGTQGRHAAARALAAASRRASRNIHASRPASRQGGAAKRRRR